MKVHDLVQSNLAIRNGLIRNLLVLRNHFPWPICHLLHKDKEHLALRNNFRATRKFLIAKFDCTWTMKRRCRFWCFFEYQTCQNLLGNSISKIEFLKYLINFINPCEKVKNLTVIFAKDTVKRQVFSGFFASASSIFIFQKFVKTAHG